MAPVEALPAELHGIADVVRVNFPWGSLLRGLLQPDARDARGDLRPRQGAARRFEIVMSYDPSHDTNAFAGEPLPPLDEAYIDSVLVPAYAESGMSINVRHQMFRDEALELPSTWGRRLLHARPRDVYFIAGDIV